MFCRAMRDISYFYNSLEYMLAVQVSFHNFDSMWSTCQLTQTLYDPFTFVQTDHKSDFETNDIRPNCKHSKLHCHTVSMLKFDTCWGWQILNVNLVILASHREKSPISSQEMLRIAKGYLKYPLQILIIILSISSHNFPFVGNVTIDFPVCIS